MRGVGIEPTKALSYYALNVARLTAPASPHAKLNKCLLKSLFMQFHVEKNNIITEHRKLYKLD